MKVPIDYPGFEGRGLVLCLENYFREAKIMVDGRSLPRINDCYLVRNNQGEQVIIRIQENGFYPDVYIDAEKFDLKVSWNKCDWLGCFLPLVLCISGPLWSLIGIIFCFLSMAVYRSNLHPRTRLALYYLITLLPFCIFVFMLRRLQNPGDIFGW